MEATVHELEPRRERRRLRALIADDDAGIRRLLKAVLELDGWEVECAADGDEALAMAREQRPDAVLLDIMMPGTDGLTALRHLRALDPAHDMPVMMVSALGDDSVVDEAREAGCDDYVVKPFAAETLSERVLRLIDGERD